MNAIRTGLAAVGVLLLAAHGGQSETSKEVSSYAPSEVAMLRAQARDAGVDPKNDQLILSTLRNRDDCRTIQKGLTAIASGATNTAVATDLQVLVAGNRARGQEIQAQYFQRAVAHFSAGNSGDLRSYVTNNCSDVT